MSEAHSSFFVLLYTVQLVNGSSNPLIYLIIIKQIIINIQMDRYCDRLLKTVRDGVIQDNNIQTGKYQLEEVQVTIKYNVHVYLFLTLYTTNQ